METKTLWSAILAGGTEKKSSIKHPVAPGGHPGDFRPAKGERVKVLGRFGILAALLALMALIGPGAVRAQDFNSRDCAWPILLSPEGSGNVQGPDAAARYWAMPFNTAQYESMTVKGTFPNIRFFSFTAYETNNYNAEHNTNQGFNLVDDHLYDAQIAPDPGSTNPFVPPGHGGGTYTVVFSRTGPSSGNTIKVPENRLVWIALRMYVANDDPSQGDQRLMGGVPLPAITLTDLTGASKQLDACTPINKWPDASAFARFLFPPDLDIDTGTPATDRLWFASALNPPSILWPNPDGKYMMMWPGNDYQPGRIIVIHGKAPGFPDSFEGSPIWKPAQGFRTVDMRYWAICEHDFALPFSVIDCATDLSTRLEGGYYTIVISNDRQRPDWLRPAVNWLPYGDEQYPKFLVIRNMLPAPHFPHAIQNVWDWESHACTFNYTFPILPDRTALDDVGPCAQNVMGEYYPEAVWCNKATFLHGGWQACEQNAASWKANKGRCNHKGERP